MTHRFPAAPPQQPADLKNDGIHSAKLVRSGLILLDDDGQTVMTIPGSTIAKGSFVIKSGGPYDVNRLQLELLVGDLVVEDEMESEVTTQLSLGMVYPQD